MATITKVKVKGGYKWKALVRRGNRSKSKTFQLKSSAKAWAAEMEKGDELAIALGQPGALITLEQLAEEYMEAYEGKDHTREQRVRFWVDSIGKTRLTDITPSLVRRHLDAYSDGKALSYGGIGKDFRPKTRQLSKKRSPASRNRMKAALAALLGFAREKEYISGRTATSDVPVLKEDNKRQRYLSDQERDRLLNHCLMSDYDRLYLLVLMGLTTGARLGELLPRKWSEVDFEKRQIRLKTSKNQEPRVLILTEPVIAELKRFRAVGEALIFPGKRRTTRPFSGFRKHWHKALKQAGIDGLHFHDLRHSCASFLLKEGFSLDQIGQVLGHKSAQTTRRYSHLDVGTKTRMIEETFGKIGGNGNDN